MPNVTTEECPKHVFRAVTKKFLTMASGDADTLLAELETKYERLAAGDHDDTKWNITLPLTKQ